jgi:hypothetical protein
VSGIISKVSGDSAFTLAQNLVIKTSGDWGTFSTVIIAKSENSFPSSSVTVRVITNSVSSITSGAEKVVIALSSLSKTISGSKDVHR